MPTEKSADEIAIERAAVIGGIILVLAGAGLFLESRWLLIFGEETVGRVVGFQTCTGEDGGLLSKRETRYVPVIQYTAADIVLLHASSKSFSEADRPLRGTEVTVVYRSKDPAKAHTRDELGYTGIKNLFAYGLVVLGFFLSLGGGPLIASFLFLVIEDSGRLATRRGGFGRF